MVSEAGVFRCGDKRETNFFQALPLSARGSPHSAWYHYGLLLVLRDIEDLLAARTELMYETLHCWTNRFGLYRRPDPPVAPAAGLGVVPR